MPEGVSRPDALQTGTVQPWQPDGTPVRPRGRQSTQGVHFDYRRRRFLKPSSRSWNRRRDDVGAAD